MSKEIEEKNREYAAELKQREKARQRFDRQSDNAAAALVGCGVIAALALTIPLLIMLWKAALR